MSMASPSELCKTETELMHRFITDFRQNTGIEGPVNFNSVADWIMANRSWSPPRRSIRSDLRRRLARAARALRHTDKQGRRVRTLHAAKYARLTRNGQLVFETMWDEIEKMSSEHARISFTQRWDQLSEKSRSLKRDMDSFQDNNPNAIDDFQLSFNFDLVLDDGYGGPEVEIIG